MEEILCAQCMLYLQVITVMNFHHFYISMSSNHTVYIEQGHGHPLKVNDVHEFQSTENALYFL